MKIRLLYSITVVFLIIASTFTAHSQSNECNPTDIAVELGQLADQIGGLQREFVEGGDTTQIGNTLNEIETQLRDLAASCTTPTSSTVPTLAPVIQPPASRGDLAIYALAVVDPSPPGMFYTPTTGTHLVSVEIVIDNQSSEPVGINPLSATLVDNLGILHTAELAASSEYSQIATLDLYPQERVRGWISFEIEDGSVPERLKYEVGIFSGTEIEVSLEQTTSELQWQPIAPILTAPSIGDMSTIAGYSLVAESVTDPASPSSFFTPTDGNRLIAVQLLIRNESSAETLSVNPLYAYLIDNLGFVYTAELGATELGQINTLDLALGEAVRGYVAFQVPNERSPLYVRYSTDFWGSDQPLIVGLSH